MIEKYIWDYIKQKQWNEEVKIMVYKAVENDSRTRGYKAYVKGPRNLYTTRDPILYRKKVSNSLGVYYFLTTTDTNKDIKVDYEVLRKRFKKYIKDKKIEIEKYIKGNGSLIKGDGSDSKYNEVSLKDYSKWKEGDDVNERYKLAYFGVDYLAGWNELSDISETKNAKMAPYLDPLEMFHTYPYYYYQIYKRERVIDPYALGFGKGSEGHRWNDMYGRDLGTRDQEQEVITIGILDRKENKNHKNNIDYFQIIFNNSNDVVRSNENYAFVGIRPFGTDKIKEWSTTIFGHRISFEKSYSEKDFWIKKLDDGDKLELDNDHMASYHEWDGGNDNEKGYYFEKMKDLLDKWTFYYDGRDMHWYEGNGAFEGVAYNIVSKVIEGLNNFKDIHPSPSEWYKFNDPYKIPKNDKRNHYHTIFSLRKRVFNHYSDNSKNFYWIRRLKSHVRNRSGTFTMYIKMEYDLNGKHHVRYLQFNPISNFSKENIKYSALNYASKKLDKDVTLTFNGEHNFLKIEFKNSKYKNVKFSKTTEKTMQKNITTKVDM